MDLLRITPKGVNPRPMFLFLVWLVYGCYYYGVNWLKTPDITVLEVAFSIPVFALITFGVYFIVDRLFAKKHVWSGLLTLIAFYLAVALITHGLVNVLNGWVDKPVNGGEPLPLWDGAFLAHLATMIGNYSLFGVAAFFVNSSIRNAKEKQAEAEARLAEVERRLKTEQEKNRFEFFMLAGQVSPHFIAGLLSGWQRMLTDIGHGIVASMERAYDLMVYYMQARDPSKRRVPLALEVEQLDRYVELALGFDGSKHIQWQYEGELAGYSIPPTSLLDLIENGTKHGRTDLPESPIRMDLTVADNQLRCVCTNVVKEHADRKSHGVGLANLKRRLELEYHNHFCLETKREGDVFVAQLIINY